MTKVTCRPFGTAGDGRPVFCYTLSASTGLTAEVLSYGGVLRSLLVPAGEGTRDVVLGFDSVADYEGQDKYIGALVGRVCNRIGGAAFSLDGVEFPLAANSGPNCLHGGVHGFHEKLWDGKTEGEALVLTLESGDGEEGFPGTLRVRVVYALSEDALSIDYSAVTDRATPVNLTNHSYFNLLGHDGGGVAGHRVQVLADAILQSDGTSCPTGALLDVAGTPFDLRDGAILAPGLESDHPEMIRGRGYDHNFVLKQTMDGALRPAARVWAGGLEMDVLTTQPGLQLYTANYLDGQRGKGGAVYPARSALCLETQNWPDAIHHPNFPGCILRPGEEYRQTTTYRFKRT